MAKRKKRGRKSLKRVAAGKKAARTRKRRGQADILLWFVMVYEIEFSV